jgi:hypothetical protein
MRLEVKQGLRMALVVSEMNFDAFSGMKIRFGSENRRACEPTMALEMKIYKKIARPGVPERAYHFFGLDSKTY